MHIIEEKKQLRCQINDIGLFIGFATVPIGREVEFFEENIKKGLFSSYKAAVRKNFTSYKKDTDNAIKFDEFEKYLYKPSPYFIFGHFDLAIISLIDDFEFGIRTFGPFDPMCQNSKENNTNLLDFAHQIIMGPIPQLKGNQDLEKTANRLFLTQTPQSLPLISICQLKLHSGTFLGTGLDILHLIISAIIIKFEEYRSKNDKIRLFISESYSWHELTLILFSSTYKKMNDFILSIRELTFSELVKAFEKPVNGISHTKNYFDLIEKIGNQRLSYAIIKTIRGHGDKDPSQCHIFETLTTTFGFRLDIFNLIAERKDGNSQLKNLIEEDEIIPTCKWFTKSGHLSSSLIYLSEFNKSVVLSCVDKGDFIYPYPESMQTRDFIESFIRLRKKLKDNHHILSSYTTISQTLDNPLKSFDTEKHLTFRQDVSLKFQISLNEIREVDSRLTLYGIPKTVSERVENMLSNFNAGIMDPSLFGYFIELRDVMRWIVDLIIGGRKNFPQDWEVEDTSNFLSSVVNAFEIAYRNRFYSGYRMNEITDFNLEFKGGIQQIASAFDAAFKAIVSSVITRNGELRHVFSIVGGTPWVYTNEYCLSLNYLHIWQPEFFASFIGHEIAYLELRHSREGSIEIPAEEEIAKFSYILSKQPLDQVMKILRKLTTPELFTYIFADITAYYINYFADIELFLFWYWGHWYTLPSSHSKVAQIHELNYVAMLMRILCVLQLCDEDFFKQDSIAQSKRIEILNNQELEKKWFEPTKKYIEEIWKVQAFGRWAAKAKESALKKFCDTAKLDYQMDNIKSLREYYRKKANEFSQELESGYPIQYKDYANELNSCNYSLILLYAYLNWIKTKCVNKNRFLKRLPENGKVKVDEGDAPSLFDSRGGMFTHDPLTRREYLRYRSTLILSFLDMSAVQKKDWVINFLKIEKDKRNRKGEGHY